MQLTIKQTQDLGLVMSLQLRQAIELLQLSSVELEQFLHEQEQVNPLVELKEPTYSIQYEQVVFKKTSREPLFQLEQTAKYEPTLIDTLLEYAGLIFKNKCDMRLVHFIIYNLDENGYYVHLEPCPYTIFEIEKGIQLLQQIGPLGIGARNLQECLLLQATYDGSCPNCTTKILQYHLDDLANRHWKKIAVSLDITLEEIKEIHNYIQTLNPKPGALLHQHHHYEITPDIVVELNEGELSFLLREQYLPQIQLHADYAPHLTTKSSITPYLKKYFSEFKWLVNSIEQRQNTMITLMNTLIKKQSDFFFHGFEALKPLTLREMAEEMAVHESTVSRVTTNKYIQTPFGTFELRSLFSSKLQTTEGNDISQVKVKSLLKELIKTENKQKPYSDQKIAEHFKKILGIDISRRTITKYREELHIPSSAKRKAH